MKAIRFILIFSLFLFHVIKGKAQEQYTKSDSIKELINKLYSENKITEINSLINQNAYIDPVYALSVVNKNIEISKKNNNVQNIAHSYLSLGNFWARHGDKTRSYESYIKSEKFSREANDLKRLGMSLIGQANIIDEFNQKVNKYEEAIDILKGNNYLV